MRTSDTVGDLFTALVKAQAKFPAIGKTAKGKVQGKGKNGDYAYEYGYAPLDHIIELTRPALDAEGLFVTQEAHTHNGTVAVTTRIVHVTGEWVEYGPLEMPGADTAQGAGSALSYARRYAYNAALGIMPCDEDDDGKTATDTIPTLASDTQVKAIYAKAHAVNIGNDALTAVLQKDFGKEHPADLTRAEASKVLDRLTAKGA